MHAFTRICMCTMFRSDTALFVDIELGTALFTCEYMYINILLVYFLKVAELHNMFCVHQWHDYSWGICSCHIWRYWNACLFIAQHFSVAMCKAYLSGIWTTLISTQSVFLWYASRTLQCALTTGGEKWAKHVSPQVEYFEGECIVIALEC